MVRRAAIRCGNDETQFRGVSKSRRRRYTTVIGHTAGAAARDNATAEAKSNFPPPDLEAKTCNDFDPTGKIRSPSRRNNAEPPPAIFDSNLLDHKIDQFRVRFGDPPLGLKLSSEANLTLRHALTKILRVKDFCGGGTTESECDSSSTIVDSPVSRDIDLVLKLASPEYL